MTSLLIPYEIGCTEDEDLIVEGDSQFFSCPRCNKKFMAYVDVINGDPGWAPKVELILCTDCEDSLDPANLYLLWLDWNSDNDVVH